MRATIELKHYQKLKDHSAYIATQIATEHAGTSRSENGQRTTFEPKNPDSEGL